MGTSLSCTGPTREACSASRKVLLTSVTSQGLFFLNRRVFESCGEYGRSKITELKLSRRNFKATTLVLHHNYNHIFGEGSDFFLGKLNCR